MKRIVIALGLWAYGLVSGHSEAWAEPWETDVANQYLPSAPSIGSPPRPGDTGSEPPSYGEDRNGSLAQDLAAAAGVVGGTIIPVTMVMVKWNETYNERSLYLDPSDREVAADLLQTYGRTSAIVTPLTSWAGFMIGGGYRQNSVRAFLCGVVRRHCRTPLALFGAQGGGSGHQFGGRCTTPFDRQNCVFGCLGRVL